MRPLHAKAFLIIHRVSEDKDPLWNEMNRAIKKGGFDYIAGSVLFVSGKGDLFVCGFLWKKEFTGFPGHQGNASASENAARPGDGNKKCSIFPGKPAPEAPARGM